MCDASPIGLVLGALDSFVESYFYLHAGSLSSRDGSLFFSDGYGDLKTVFDIRKAYRQALQDGNVPFRLQENDIEWRELVVHENVTIQEGYFMSPLQHVLPPESQKCRFHLVKPRQESKNNRTDTATTPTPNVYVIMLASTGEAGKKSRLALARELARAHCYTSIIVTSPYYGHRKPANQSSFYLRTISDLWKQFGGTIQEAAALVDFYYRTDDDCRLCLTGFSAGGALAICTAWAAVAGYQLNGSRIGVAAYVAPASAGIYAMGALQNILDWSALRSDPNEPLEVTKQQVYENLDMLSVSSITGIDHATTSLSSTNCHGCRRLGSIRFCAGTRDSFSPSYYSRVLQEQLPSLVQNPAHCVMEWHAFGHVYAGLARSRLQKQLVVDTIQPLLLGVTSCASPDE